VAPSIILCGLRDFVVSIPEMNPAATDLQSLPKVDLHRHLEGSIRLTTLVELAERGEIPLPANQAKLKRMVTVQPGDPASHAHFLSRFGRLRQVFQSEAIIRRIAAEAVEDARLDGVRHLELHLTPPALAQAADFDYEDVIEWVWQAGSSAAGSDLSVGLVVSLNRHEPVSLAERAVAAALAQPEGVIALDLAGDEAAHDAAPFADLLARAKQAGVFISVHAGEWNGPGSVRQAIELLGADRIAHGVRAMEDRDTVLMARDRGIPFAVCLTSNVQSGVVGGYADHPLPAMIQAGLQVSLNTDDPSVSGIRLTDEYQLAVDMLGLSVESIQMVVLAGAQSAFLPAKPKASLVDSLQQAFGLSAGE